MGNFLKRFFSPKKDSFPKVLTKSGADPRDLLFVSDLDGTLLDSHGALSPEYIDRLNKMIDRGLKFTIATARNYDSVYPILKELKLNIPTILFNGVYLTEFLTGRNVFLTEFIAREIIENMLAIASPLGIDPFIYTFGERHKVYFRKTDNPGSKSYIQSLEGDGRLRKIEKYEFPLEEQITGFLLIHDKKTLKPIYHSLKKKYPEEINLYFAEDVSLKGYYWLQGFNQETNKGKMVKLLAQYLKLPLKNVVVFGDFHNDVEMFKMAGHSIAVSNAIPEIKKIADEIIGNNQEGAVINYLESLGFNK